MKKALLFFKKNYYAQKVFPFCIEFLFVWCLLNGYFFFHLKQNDAIGDSFFSGLGVSFLQLTLFFLPFFFFFLALIVGMPPLKKNGWFDKTVTNVGFFIWTFSLLITVFRKIYVSQKLVSFEKFIYQSVSTDIIWVNIDVVFTALLLGIGLLFLWQKNLFPQKRVPIVKNRLGFVFSFFIIGCIFYWVVFKTQPGMFFIMD